MRCSAVAEELDEAMVGSVDQRFRWLLVEDRSAWGTDAVKDVLGADFASAAKRRKVRVLLVRRREGDPAADAVRRVMLVDTRSREMAIRTVRHPSELTIDAVAEAPIAEFGAPMQDQIFLVCTNGKRDACCALRGRALMTALAADHAERTWECTHLGGHRFAGNLVCLPDGIVYGRVTAADGPRLADAYLAGRVEPAQMRGRSSWPAPAQVAEQALRTNLGLHGVLDVGLHRSTTEGTRARVTLMAGGRGHEFELLAERPGPPRGISCRADDLEQPLHWRIAGTG
ncbi:MAG: sucrase ferredoxin [Chloroflexota bacterium]|nr:sucrase ferredoxin [Chloroflexota bacterium]